MQPYHISLGNPVTSGRNSSPDRVLVGQKKISSFNKTWNSFPTISKNLHFSQEFLSPAAWRILKRTPSPAWITALISWTFDLTVLGVEAKPPEMDWSLSLGGRDLYKKNMDPWMLVWEMCIYIYNYYTKNMYNWIKYIYIYMYACVCV